MNNENFDDVETHPRFDSVVLGFVAAGRVAALVVVVVVVAFVDFFVFD